MFGFFNERTPVLAFFIHIPDPEDAVFIMAPGVVVLLLDFYLREVRAFVVSFVVD